ncbi:type II toxin-antitoxin system death-on-curing family toxin [Rathayibacter sp. VKM Ac-2760]|uniref:type II toxin-antitoxin system death-on-curing family toxin n=1 Tax=Rathayibacter sp. VKM Ac-2760 TaxID=2609253 RepID=UPI0013197015|nr:type II toxin-antitoxin system death-on-curing family toxin [Rathayibacter sp. VKM Ac-2760]QHC59392.1 type II toxin-antitoxin system death-on-curing family toxin [Rathayibacter sp. VKM Ac-2760]
MRSAAPIRYLRVEDLLALAEDLGVPHVRDLGLLDSAAHRPQSSLYGREAYPAIHLKAAVLLESLVRNHPLVDGNKRLGWLSVVVFLGLNGLELDAPEDDAYDLVIGVATGSAEVAETASLLERWTRTVE